LTPAAAKAAPGVAVEASAPAADTGGDAATESPLLNFFRRAVNTPPAAEQPEVVKP
jgi:hypothetical protein